MRISPEAFLKLDLEAHRILEGVPLKDVSIVDLPCEGERDLSDVRRVLAGVARGGVSPLVRALFAIRMAVGRLLRWDAQEQATGGPPDPESFVQRLTPAQIEASEMVPGTPDGGFVMLFLTRRESVAELRNATVHAFSCLAVERRPGGLRLYWAIYVLPVSRFTPLYMAAIEPFRRFVVYPTLLRKLRGAWIAAGHETGHG
jgi:hypothetical protein